MTDSTPHVSATPVTHGGPGHRYGDPGYCGGCFWEQIGQWEPPRRRESHAADCPACPPAALTPGADTAGATA